MATPEPDDLEYLAELAPAVPPPRALRDRVLAAARGVTFAFVMRGEGVWLPSTEAPVACKPLLADSRDRIATRLVRLAEGGALPSPPLGGRRALYVLEGAVRDDDASLTLGAGDVVDEYPAARWTATAATQLVELTQGGGDTPSRELRRGADAPALPIIPDGTIRLLLGELGSARALFVLTMLPNAILAEHEHGGVEELYILSGSCVVEGRRMAAGDYHRAALHSSHAPTQTFEEGCVLLVSVRDAERLGGATATV